MQPADHMGSALGCSLKGIGCMRKMHLLDKGLNFKISALMSLFYRQGKRGVERVGPRPGSSQPVGQAVVLPAAPTSPTLTRALSPQRPAGDRHAC